MQLDLHHPEFSAAIPILQALEAAGYEAYFVGGSVRDVILGLPVHDVDIATSAYPAEVKTIFAKTVDTGIKHGTVMVLQHGTGYEVTTFRTESGYQDFRRPDHVTFVRDLREDLKRRDFTVNALALRHDGSVIDLFDGLTDLRKGVLRAVGQPQARFHEDALRMMRAVRFESQLHFTIEAQTLAAIAENAPLLEKISIERIAGEFERLLMGRDRQAGLQDFINTRLFAYTPMLASHADALVTLSQASTRALSDPAVGWTALLLTTGLSPQKFLRAWKQSNQVIALVTQAVAFARLGDKYDAFNLYQTGAKPLEIALEALMVLNDTTTDAPKVRAVYAALPIHDKREMAISGQDLIAQGFKPGRELGQRLAYLEHAVVLGELANQAELLIDAAHRWPENAAGSDSLKK